MAESRTQRLAEMATRLLPHLALALYRAIQQEQPTDHLLKAIAEAGKYLDVAKRAAK